MQKGMSPAVTVIIIVVVLAIVIAIGYKVTMGKGGDAKATKGAKIDYGAMQGKTPEAGQGKGMQATPPPVGTPPK